jgi:hypothetical protein
MAFEPEIRRLLEVMPASGRMQTKILGQANQGQVINYRPLSLSFSETPISINFDLWLRLPRPQQDLLILRAVAWLQASNWFKFELYQGIGLVGILGALVELIQLDAVGVMTAGGLTAISALQIWRNNRGMAVELAADQEAIRVAQRRGYPETEAARHLLAAIQAVADLENRPTLDLIELIRCQNLRTLAGLSATAMSETG